MKSGQTLRLKFADRDLASLLFICARRRCELATLICLEDLWFAVAREEFPERLNAETAPSGAWTCGSCASSVEIDRCQTTGALSEVRRRRRHVDRQHSCRGQHTQPCKA